MSSPDAYLYLMLTRAKRGAELGDSLAKRLFDHEAPMNRLVRALQGAPQSVEEPRLSGYLPEVANNRFDQICNDWLSILNKDMPIYDALEHLIAITGLNMLLYFLERAKRVAGDDDPVEIVCEIVSKERTKVRALSGDSYQFNQGLPAKAVRAHVESIRSDVGWIEAESRDSPDAERVKLMRDRFQWPPTEGGDDEDVADKNPEELVANLVENALARHERNRLANSPLSTQTSSDKNGWKTKPCPQVYPLNKPVSDVGHAEPASGSQSTMASLYTSAPHTP